MSRKGRRSPIGLDIGRRRVKAAQFHRAAGGWRLGAVASIRRIRDGPDVDAAEVRRLKQRLAELGFKGNRLVLAVPADNLLTGIMELPPAESGAPVDQLARAELARMHKCDPAALEVRCWPLPTPARAARASFVMGVGCRHEDADRLLDIFEAEGFDVERLEVQAGALARACAPLLEDVAGAAGILDIGYSAARLVLLYHGTVVYERRLNRGGVSALFGAGGGDGEESDEAAGSAPGIDAEARQRYVETLIDEMRIPLSYMASQYPDAPLQRLLLVGGGAGLPGLAEALGPALECDVRAVGAGDLPAGRDGEEAGSGTDVITALGLAQPEEG